MGCPRRLTLAGAGTLMLMGLAAPSFADIGWTWNSGDHDAEAMFQSYGELIKAKEYEGNDYIDYDPPGASVQRWYIPGTEQGTTKYNELAYDENLDFKMQVCETKFAAPDDCSAWKQTKT